MHSVALHGGKIRADILLPVYLSLLHVCSLLAAFLVANLAKSQQLLKVGKVFCYHAGNPIT